MEDRISVLPDEIIHHIFSFMNTPDVIHTSILSTRWKHLWLSTPTLNFTYHTPNCEYINFDDCSDPQIRCDNCKQSRINHINFADRFLITQRPQSNLIKFQMCNFIDMDANHLITWFIGILGLHAQEIILYFKIDDYIHLPYNLFNTDIRVLELRFVGRSVFLPNSCARATRLKTLDLRNVRFAALDEFVLNCPVLETLKMWDCDLSDIRLLTISTPLLERLELHSLYIIEIVFYERYLSEEGPCKVKAIAPNLRSLHVAVTVKDQFNSVTSVDVCVEGVVTLDSASISIGVTPDDEFVVEHCAKPLIEALTGIPKVEALKVSYHLIQVITAIPESLEMLPKLFHNVKSLMLVDEDIWCHEEKDLKVQEVLIFLERLPHIETLVWERRHKNCTDEDLEATMLSQSIFSCLKSFEYRNFVASDAEQKFVELLLGRAPVLNEMIIKTPRLSSRSAELPPIKKKLLSLSRYRDKLLSLPRASSNVTISYQLRSRNLKLF